VFSFLTSKESHDHRGGHFKKLGDLGSIHSTGSTNSLLHVLLPAAKYVLKDPGAFIDQIPKVTASSEIVENGPIVFLIFKGIIQLGSTFRRFCVLGHSSQDHGKSCCKGGFDLLRALSQLSRSFSNKILPFLGI